MSNNLKNISYEIIVVNDGSSDGMDKMLEKETLKNSNLRLLHHSYNMGRGRAVRTGIEKSQSDYLIALDADLSYSPDHIKLLLEPLINSRADLTLASPYHVNGIVKNVPLFRFLLSKWGNFFLSSSFKSDVKTVTCTVRGYSRDLMDHLELINNGKDFHLEVLYKTELLGFKVEEVPAKLIWRDKDRGKDIIQNANPFTRNSLFKMRKTIFSHIAFIFFSRPHLLFFLPMLILLASIIYGIFNMLVVLLNLLGNDKEIIDALRITLLQGQLTFQIVIGAVILFFILLLFLFLATQSKKYFEEQYIQNARMNVRLKQMKNLEKN